MLLCKTTCVRSISVDPFCETTSFKNKNGQCGMVQCFFSSGLGLGGIKKCTLFCGPFGSFTDLNFKICVKNGAISF